MFKSPRCTQHMNWRRQSPITKPILYSVVFLLCASLTHASPSPKKVAYGGVSYLGEYQHLSEAYPHALAINKSSKAAPVGALDRTLFEHLQQSPPKGFVFQDGLANLKVGDSLVATVALDKEHISVERVGKRIKVIVEVSTQVLIFDMKAQLLKVNIPVDFAVNHVVSSPAQLEKELPKLFSHAYLGVDGQSGLIGKAASTLSSIQIQEESALRFHVRSVTTSDKASSLISQYQKNALVEQYAGQYFSSQLVVNNEIDVLPYVQGYAIGKQLAGRFANGDVYNIKLPAADYVFQLELNDFRVRPIDDNKGYFARIGLTLIEPFQKKTLIDGHYYYGVPKLTLSDTSKVDEWSAYEDAIEALLQGLAKQLGQPEKKWLRSHGGTKQNVAQFKKKKEIFNDS